MSDATNNNASNGAKPPPYFGPANAAPAATANQLEQADAAAAQGLDAQIVLDQQAIEEQRREQVAREKRSLYLRNNVVGPLFAETLVAATRTASPPLPDAPKLGSIAVGVIGLCYCVHRAPPNSTATEKMKHGAVGLLLGGAAGGLAGYFVRAVGAKYASVEMASEMPWWVEQELVARYPDVTPHMAEARAVWLQLAEKYNGGQPNVSGTVKQILGTVALAQLAAKGEKP